MAQNDTLGKKISELRKSVNLQQEEFAERIGVSRQALSQWETDKQIPRADKISEICIQFGINANYFYDNENIIKANKIEEKPTENSLMAQNAVKVERKKITLRQVYDLWRIIRGWIILACALFFGISLFIVQISPNINATSVRVFLIDWTGLTVILFLGMGILFMAQIVRTVLYISQRKKENDDEKK